MAGPLSRREIKSASEEQLVREFADAVERFFMFRDGPEFSLSEADKAHKLAEAIFDEAEARGDSVISAFQVLFDDPRPGVRLRTATKLKALFPERAEAIYSELATHQSTIGFSAQNALDRMRGVDRFSK